MLHVVYSRHYNIGFYGLERLHPFDSRKYGRAWKVLGKRFGKSLRNYHICPDRQANREELQLVHTDQYLARLRDSAYVARAIEIPQLRYAPSFLIDFHVLRPMRWATRGTIIAAESAIENGLSVNLSGGYHHAKPNHGEGFSIYADAAIAIARLRKHQQLKESDRIIIVDTDAHQGNGVCHTYMNDHRVFIFDVFNSHIYPMFDVDARKRIDCEIPVTSDTSDKEYMSQLRSRLPGFLDSVCNTKVGLAVYHAGTDVYENDPLGGLHLSAATILDRDLFVISELRKRQIPSIMMLSGGYTAQSFMLVANTITRLIELAENTE